MPPKRKHTSAGRDEPPQKSKKTSRGNPRKKPTAASGKMAESSESQLCPSESKRTKQSLDEARKRHLQRMETALEVKKVVYGSRTVESLCCGP